MAKNLTTNTLNIEVKEHEDKKTLEVIWNGKSIDLNPDNIFQPFFDEIIEELKSKNYSIVINFFPLVYMNSSTMNSIIFFIKKLLEQKIKTKVVYNRDLKWQDLNFSTLEIFINNNNGLFELEKAHLKWKLS